ncbi:MAG: hypothetical protein KGK11_06490, partial [Sphingomonadales bacterium]|nr:hypothetical protein [Sphingomonadales bacterium]
NFSFGFRALMAASVNIHTLQIGQNVSESARLYRQVKNGPSDWHFLFSYRALRQKIYRQKLS